MRPDAPVWLECRRLQQYGCSWARLGTGTLGPASGRGTYGRLATLLSSRRAAARICQPPPTIGSPQRELRKRLSPTPSQCENEYNPQKSCFPRADSPQRHIKETFPMTRTDNEASMNFNTSLTDPQDHPTRLSILEIVS